MSKMKILDLDGLEESEVVTIVLNGTRHQLKEMSVQDFIWSQQEIKRQDKLDELGQFESLLKLLARQFPTATEAEFRALPMSKLRKLMDFVNNIATEGAEGVAAQAADANPPKAEQAP